MWVKFEQIPDEGDVVRLPPSWSDRITEPLTIKFGGRDPVPAEVEYKDDLSDENNSFENPAVIPISISLCQKLLLQTALTYRVKIVVSSIRVGPVIGFLLGIHTHRYNPEHMRKYSDRMGIYSKVGGIIYAFSPKSVNWEKRETFGLFYNVQTAEWEYGCFPLPDVIYRRDFHSSPLYIEKLMALTQNRLFNSYRFSKMEFYEFLAADKDIKDYLPETEITLNPEQIIKFVNRHQKVILKPIDLSRGRGMCIIEKFDTLYKVTDYRYRKQIMSIFEDKQSLERFLNLNPSFFDRYIVQKYLNLAKIGVSRFDIRVVMQKDAAQEWGCTGIECRVSYNSHLTNISRGGYALTLSEALERAFFRNYDSIAREINRLCLKVCRRFDQMGHHFAEFGMDIAVDENKNIWLIEANVFPSFKGFKATDRDTYLAIRYKPLLYALSLTEFGEKNESEGSDENL
ncbi:MAG TPA: YheC/YheD family protein [Bacillota bacterium]|nr:YheC/YheD family protein [Bacillota bacterium]